MHVYLNLWTLPRWKGSRNLVVLYTCMCDFRILDNKLFSVIAPNVTKILQLHTVEITRNVHEALKVKEHSAWCNEHSTD